VIDVAIIGTGAISSSHIEAYLTFPQRCRIVAVVDIYPEKAARQVAAYHLDAVVADDVREVLEGRGIQLASVCTPPGTHAPISIELLEHGIHTLCEKPMAASLQECDAMLAAAQRAGATLSVVAQNRFRTPMMRLKHLLDAGVAGRVLHAQVDSYWWRGPSYYDLWWRGTWEKEGGGCTLNHAVHHVDALQWMVGMPVEVQAMMANVAHDNAEVEDLSVAVMRFESGAIGQLTSSVVHHGQNQQIVFQTDKAKVGVPWDVYASTPRPNGFPERDQATEAALTDYYEALPSLVHQGHVGQVDDVLSALERDGRGPLIDGLEGRKTLEIVTALYKSAITSQRVVLPVRSDDLFFTKEGLLAAAPHFHEKSVMVSEFTDNQITTTGRER